MYEHEFTPDFIHESDAKSSLKVFSQMVSERMFLNLLNIVCQAKYYMSGFI